MPYDSKWLSLGDKRSVFTLRRIHSNIENRESVFNDPEMRLSLAGMMINTSVWRHMTRPKTLKGMTVVM
jgi:hypothetical protein